MRNNKKRYKSKKQVVKLVIQDSTMGQKESKNG